MHTIQDIFVEIVKDSRNVDTLSVTVVASNGSKGTCMVPSGASTGSYEAYELRDDGTSHGGVTKAKENILSIIKPALLSYDISKQTEIDHVMLSLDGTKNKQKLGGNSILGVSVACAKAAAQAEGKEFYEYLSGLAPVTSTLSAPRLYFNLINGGKHATTKLAFQEYHIVPHVDSITESLEIAKRVQDTLGELIADQFGSVTKGDEGGYALPTEDIKVPLMLLTKAVDMCGVKDKVHFALDVASTSFYDAATELYHIGEASYTKDQLHDLYVELVSEFPILSIEDPFFEEDFESFAKLQNALPETIIVGDDLTVTNIERVTRACDMGSISGLLVKPNQIGSLTETIATISYAQEKGVKCIISHRSGETLDDMIADITEAFHSFGMKSGARGPKEREIKYARLAAIHH